LPALIAAPNKLCLPFHLPPLDQNLLFTRDAIINLPVVEVKRRRDGGG
jgi:hypothetical protein